MRPAWPTLEDEATAENRRANIKPPYEVNLGPYDPTREYWRRQLMDSRRGISFDILLKLLPYILAIAGIWGNYMVLNARIDQQAIEIARNTSEANIVRGTLVDIQVRLARIEENGAVSRQYLQDLLDRLTTETLSR